MNILVIPDSHAHPDYSNDRFEWLGHFIMDKRPDLIIDIGDSADMASLCSYDKGTLRSEGRRYADDLTSYFDAMEKLWRPLNEYNSRRSRNKKRQYTPYRVKCIGNHEQRILRAGVTDPAMHGHLRMEDLRQHEWYDEVVPFLNPYIVEDIAFSHYFTSGVMGNPIGGVHPAASLVRKNLMSCVAGHSHMRDYSESTRPDGRRVFGLVVGCYVDYDPDWTGEHTRWWRGVVMLENAKNGTADPCFYSLDYLRDMYA